MGACDCDCYENLMGRLEKRYMSITKNTNSQIEKTNTLIKNDNLKRLLYYNTKDCLN